MDNKNKNTKTQNTTRKNTRSEYLNSSVGSVAAENSFIPVEVRTHDI